MKPENIFESIPKVIDAEIFDVLLEHNNLKVERIVSRGQASPKEGWYDQNRNEWVIVLKGEATIAFEDGAQTNLTAGSYINIQAHTRHRVSWTRPDSETVWLAVHY